MLFGERIRQRREELGLSQEELANKLGYKSRSSINKIELGINDVSQSKILSLAKALDTTVSYLMGDEDKTDLSEYGLKPIKAKKFRMLGEIACGKPIFCNEDFETYIEASADIDADFCVTAHGDSMTGARIFNGDVVFIKAQPIVENGEIAVVIINDEATLKRVYFYQDENKLVLQAENNKYAPLMFVGDEINAVRILGKAVSFNSLAK